MRRLLPVLLLLLPGPVGAQTATLTVEENFRADPAGIVLGRLQSGLRLPVLERRERWVKVAVEGWVWTPSLQRTGRLGFDLVVSTRGGENLRAKPSGRIVGRLNRGTLLEKLEEVPGWHRVRREGWIWAASVEVEEAVGPLPDTSAGEERAPPAPRTVWREVGEGGLPVLTGPDGDTLARLLPGAQLQILGREGNWVRLRLEGWSWLPEAGEVGDSSVAAPSSLSPREVQDAPETSRGALVAWDLDFISLERAERIRTDFYEGEPFLLTRSRGRDPLYVYVAVPPERLTEVQGLIPMERIRVVGRVRTGAAAFTGNPILDLLELTRPGSGKRP